VGARHPDVSCSSALSNAYTASCLTIEATYHLVSEYGSLKIIGDLVYFEFLDATEVPRLALSCTTQAFLGIERD
jgi:hypothetical protein